MGQVWTTVHSTIAERFFAAPVRAGWSRVGGDYTLTYCRGRHGMLSVRSFRYCGIHCSWHFILIILSFHYCAILFHPSYLDCVRKITMEMLLKIVSDLCAKGQKGNLLFNPSHIVDHCMDPIDWTVGQVYRAKENI